MLGPLAPLFLHEYMIQCFNTKIIYLFTKSNLLKAGQIYQDRPVGFLLSSSSLVIKICSIDALVLWVPVTLRLKVSLSNH
jgi:hypothetical protein